jgi:uncharacterized protein YggL (DUF469 family)
VVPHFVGASAALDLSDSVAYEKLVKPLSLPVERPAAHPTTAGCCDRETVPGQPAPLVVAGARREGVIQCSRECPCGRISPNAVVLQQRSKYDVNHFKGIGPMSQRRTRRQRKKLRVAEFQEFGFLVAADLAVGLRADARITACEAFIADCIEANQLTYGGSIDDRLDGFVSPEGKRGSSTEEHRRIVLDWLNGRAEFGTVRVGPLIDAWYGKFTELG